MPSTLKKIILLFVFAPFFISCAPTLTKSPAALLPQAVPEGFTNFTEQDLVKVQEVLQYTPSYDTNQWTNNASGITYAITPHPVTHEDGQVVCRKAELKVKEGAPQSDMVFGACRQNGVWEISE